MRCWIRDGAAAFDAAQVLRTARVAMPQKKAGTHNLVEKATAGHYRFATAAWAVRQEVEPLNVALVV